MNRACAFAPGHVTGFFAVHDAFAEPVQNGSRGGGWCLHKGAYASVLPLESGDTEIRINGEDHEAPVTRRALDLLAPKHAFEVDIHIQLPLGQGFGMSAAGTLATCLAVARLLDLEPEEALAATHASEVEQGAGLGDAVGSWFGGAELRIRPGCPPHGWAMQIAIPEGTEFLFCVLGGEISTKSIIQDHGWKEKTRRHGDAAVDRVLEAGRGAAWEQLLNEAVAFSAALGLRPDHMVALGQQLPEDVHWGQSMLGTTMWVQGAPGDLDRAEALLEGHGRIIRSRVEPNGARLVRSIPPVPVGDP